MERQRHARGEKLKAAADKQVRQRRVPERGISPVPVYDSITLPVLAELDRGGDVIQGFFADKPKRSPGILCRILYRYTIHHSESQKGKGSALTTAGTSLAENNVHPHVCATFKEKYRKTFRKAILTWQTFARTR